MIKNQTSITYMICDRLTSYTRDMSNERQLREQVCQIMGHMPKPISI